MNIGFRYGICAKDNVARLHLFALAYNLANFLRQLALPNKGVASCALAHAATGQVLAMLSWGESLQPLQCADSLSCWRCNHSSGARSSGKDRFSRRTHYVVEFPQPDGEHRELLWSGMFPPELRRANEG